MAHADTISGGFSVLHVDVNLFVGLHVHVCIYIYRYTYVPVYVYTDVYVFVCVYVYVYVCMYGCMFVRLYVCMHLCMHVCMYNVHMNYACTHTCTVVFFVRLFEPVAVGGFCCLHSGPRRTGPSNLGVGLINSRTSYQSLYNYSMYIAEFLFQLLRLYSRLTSAAVV